MTDLNLTGRWESRDYECPWGVKHTELVDIVHDDELLVATKFTGDPCVPAGFETFHGRLPKAGSVAALVWTMGLPAAPASDTTPGFLEVVDANELRAGWPASETVIVFRRLIGNQPEGLMLKAAGNSSSLIKVFNK